MLFILRWLKRLWKRTIVLTPPPVPVAASVPVTAPVSPAAPIVTEISANRHERRKLEKARRKYDKFVTPKGALLSGFNVGVMDEYWCDEESGKTISMPEFGKRLKGWMDEGRGRHHA